MNQSLESSELSLIPQNYFAHLSGRCRHMLNARRYAAHESQPIAFPEARHRLRRELASSRRLGITPDGKHIYLFRYRPNSSVLKELGRLRELTFRAVGEGTQRSRDIDEFDKTYLQIILWNDQESEIVGSYRVGEAFNLVKKRDTSALYTNGLFDYRDQFINCMPQALELGRSFIQPKYWTKRGLDYLWQGIGAYLQAHPNIRYLFGAVSISNELPDLAKQQIVACYQHYFQPDNHDQFAAARLPFQTNRSILESYRDKSFAQASAHLKQSLKRQGVSLPTLYKHYAELCEPQGVRFIDFNIDPKFSFCVDGLMLVDLSHIKPQKRKRYLTPSA
ncbi:GNAT family N-acetyltransferase [Arenicella xantha]|uniref:L-ornithine N(alpha)-acyltransferase n=1 Tax=Arenicella xantha TaxID=644221 RepID=A0A395JI85_9GAMM|nr:GNAT family N-acetyltransferase [Arenicella xantha]RBP48454.1 putative hemolysin [Arenicella xantha]